MTFARRTWNGYRITEQFDLIINFNFLLRELIAEEVQALTPGGLLIIDTIMASPALLESHNPAYLLQPGELKRTFEGLEGELLLVEELQEGEFPTARALFRKRD